MYAVALSGGVRALEILRLDVVYAMELVAPLHGPAVHVPKPPAGDVGPKMGWKQQSQVLAHNLRFGMAKDPLGAAVPTGDSTLSVQAVQQRRRMVLC
jgi:hypothetical protein